MSNKINNGFTLIELLVVVLIIGILAAIALPQYQNSVEKSRFAESFLFSKALGQAQDIYKLTAGSPAFTFDNLEIAVPNAAQFSGAGGLSHAAGGGLRGPYFDYAIDLVNNSFWYGAIAVLRNSGKYNKCGFVYSNGQIYCVQPAGSTLPFCVNLYGGVKTQSNNAGWDIYTVKH
jgi:prepilin-type N-terminal cleavage/methylation domain-containing protein